MGGTDDTHEGVVVAFMNTLPDPPGDRPAYYEKGECWGDWVVNDAAYKVTLVAVAPAQWAFAVFADGPYFQT